MQKLRLNNPAPLRAALHEALAGSAQARRLHRLHCVLLADAGVNCAQVALAFGIHPRTVQRWVSAARRAGVAGLAPARPAGRPAALNLAELAQWPSLAPLISNDSSAGAGQLQEEITRRTGHAPSLRHCRRILATLRLQAR